MKIMYHHSDNMKREDENPSWDQISWLSLEHLLNTSPVIAKTPITFTLFGKETQGSLLHMVCHRNAPLYIFQSLIDIFPFALDEKDSTTQSLPIHIACMSDLPLATIQTLVNAFPMSVNKKDKLGNIPLHIASLVASPETALFLLETSPKSAKSPNKSLQLPLHMACQRHVSSTILIKKFIEVYEQSPLERDSEGRIPLHYAMLWSASVETIEALIEVNPQSVLFEDNDNHNALSFGMIAEKKLEEEGTLIQTIIRGICESEIP